MALSSAAKDLATSTGIIYPSFGPHDSLHPLPQCICLSLLNVNVVLSSEVWLYSVGKKQNPTRPPSLLELNVALGAEGVG